MKEEEINKEKRKNISLTTMEWLGFFILPFKSNSSFNDTFTFNKTEIKRFEKFGFKKKLEESKEVRNYGLVFYIILFILLVFLFS
ncbi:MULTISPECIES: hypothetical protein [Tenacibaculum]|uniref:hypothetical protein n=1 Tax=Tenacibaculum TaxID=104267 RepID=UPI001F0A3B60|nr:MULTISPECIES: hypothetical protein [Tenacibaculum]MCH3881108.1 hypothetical protein [Tenacibaculum aquimarinum]MDO6599292.1 hypothetical protein [Tenacibaculum sp. 1_MG-2023]